MRALGIDTAAKNQKVDWETYLDLHRMLSGNCNDIDALRRFGVKLFDPPMTGFVESNEFENIVR